MANSPKNVHTVVPKDLREHLKAHKRPRQVLAGVTEELLNESERNVNSQIKAVAKPNQTLDCLLGVI